LRRDAAFQGIATPIVSVVGLITCALPGLVPVILLLAEASPPDVRRAGTYIQVYYRLAHHLDPMAFSIFAYAVFLGMLIVWGLGAVLLCRGDRATMKDAGPGLPVASNDEALFRRWAFWNGIVFWSLMFAVGGWIVGAGPRPPKYMAWFMERATLLKFYPFRLPDVVLPMSIGLVLARLIERAVARHGLSMSDEEARPANRLISTTCLLGLVALIQVGLARESNRFSYEDRKDWLDVCQWVDQNLPQAALVQAPHNGWAFKWFARRAEYVTFKDCPQDAAGIVEWNRRLNFLKHWTEKHIEDGLYAIEELRAFRETTGITHWVSDYLGPFELEPIYRNGTFQVYDLSSIDEMRHGE
jgi:hypothetical protein